MMPTIGPDSVGISCGSAASPSTAGMLLFFVWGAAVLDSGWNWNGWE